jgi:hypothetical protein
LIFPKSVFPLVRHLHLPLTCSTDQFIYCRCPLHSFLTCYRIVTATAMNVEWGKLISPVKKPNHATYFSLHSAFSNVTAPSLIPWTASDWLLHDMFMFIFNYALQPFKAYCAIWSRRSNFRHQASPRVSPRESTQRRKVELWARNFREFCLNAEFYVTFRDLLHAIKVRHGTDGFTSPPKEDMLRIFSP